MAFLDELSAAVSAEGLFKNAHEFLRMPKVAGSINLTCTGTSDSSIHPLACRASTAAFLRTRTQSGSVLETGGDYLNRILD